MDSPGKRFRQLLIPAQPLQIAGTVNAYSAMMATEIGHRAIYLSGGACAAVSYGMPDLGITNLNDVLSDVRRITAVVDTPLMVDIDTGFGDGFGIARTIREMERAGAAAVHMEDQVGQKRCGHRPNKELVSANEMVDRIKAAVDARQDDQFFIMARTDAFAKEGLAGAIERSQKYIEAGADAIFAEAFQSLDDYQQLKQATERPVLANMTEFGVTPLFELDELAKADVDMVLYPLTAARAMNKVAETVYRELLERGSQKNVVDQMQTREELYGYLGYHQYESQLDRLFGNSEN